MRIFIILWLFKKATILSRTGDEDTGKVELSSALNNIRPRQTFTLRGSVRWVSGSFRQRVAHSVFFVVHSFTSWDILLRFVVSGVDSWALDVDTDAILEKRSVRVPSGSRGEFVHNRFWCMRRGKKLK